MFPGLVWYKIISNTICTCVEKEEEQGVQGSLSSKRFNKLKECKSDLRCTNQG